jgi:phosphoribosylformylglycinamidine (FGAM) synthase-like enzyme
LFFNLMESAIAGQIGFDVYSDSDYRADGFWFGEAAGRIVVSIHERHEEDLVNLAADFGVEALYLGETGSNTLNIDGETWGTVDSFAAIHQNEMEKLFN